MLTDTEILARFERWFATAGHWAYSSRAHAVRTWLARGIDGLPAPSAQLRAALAAGGC